MAFEQWTVWEYLADNLLLLDNYVRKSVYVIKLYHMWEFDLDVLMNFIKVSFCLCSIDIQYSLTEFNHDLMSWICFYVELLLFLCKLVFM